MVSDFDDDEMDFSRPGSASNESGSKGQSGSSRPPTTSSLAQGKLGAMGVGGGNYISDKGASFVQVDESVDGKSGVRMFA